MRTFPRMAWDRVKKSKQSQRRRDTHIASYRPRHSVTWELQLNLYEHGRWEITPCSLLRKVRPPDVREPASTQTHHAKNTKAWKFLPPNLPRLRVLLLQTQPFSQQHNQRHSEGNLSLFTDNNCIKYCFPAVTSNPRLTSKQRLMAKSSSLKLQHLSSRSIITSIIPDHNPRKINIAATSESDCYNSKSLFIQNDFRLQPTQSWCRKPTRLFLTQTRHKDLFGAVPPGRKVSNSLI